VRSALPLGLPRIMIQTTICTLANVHLGSFAPAYRRQARKPPNTQSFGRYSLFDETKQQQIASSI